MTKSLKSMFKSVVCAGGIASCLLVAAPAQAQDVVEEYPPAEFIATATPVYHEGRPAYYYHNRWHYRYNGAWRYYREEPVFLRDWRVHRAPVRAYYGRAHFGGYRR
jgi:hypothetical protein